MPFARTHAVALTGLTGHVVTVEAHVADGLPAFSLSGLADAACAQAPHRIRAATSNVGLRLDPRRWTVNLSPAGIPKQGTGFDLAVAVAQLAAQRLIPVGAAEGVVHIGELGLDGSVRAVPGVLPMVLAAQESGMRDVVVPGPSVREAQLVPQMRVWPVETLTQAVELHTQRAEGGSAAPRPASVTSTMAAAALGNQHGQEPDMADIRGQAEARAALEIAAAGGHHMLLVGPPGAGKTMLAERLPGLLPRLSRQAALEVTSVHSVLGALGQDDALVERPPFVAPHHSASVAAVIGGGNARIKPGAVSRAHHGVLFLDETPEFRRDVLDGLRQPLESGRVVIARAERHVELPSAFQLIAAANPCPCGRWVGKGEGCRCTPLAKRQYFGKLSGPLLDRIDARVVVSAVGRLALAAEAGESTEVVAARVARARDLQARRWAGQGWSLNAHAPGPVLREAPYRPSAEATSDLSTAVDRGHLSLRGYDRCLRLAWTMADLAGADGPRRSHIQQALALRSTQEMAA